LFLIEQEVTGIGDEETKIVSLLEVTDRGEMVVSTVPVLRIPAFDGIKKRTMLKEARARKINFLAKEKCFSIFEIIFRKDKIKKGMELLSERAPENEGY
jgi:hypothetical protein